MSSSTLPCCATIPVGPDSEDLNLRPRIGSVNEVQGMQAHGSACLGEPETFDRLPTGRGHRFSFGTNLVSPWTGPTSPAMTLPWASAATPSPIDP
jgi:hypothetical protein